MQPVNGFYTNIFLDSITSMNVHENITNCMNGKVDYQNYHELDCIQSVNLFTPPLYKYMLFIGCPLPSGWTMEWTLKPFFSFPCYYKLITQTATATLTDTTFINTKQPC